MAMEEEREWVLMLMRKVSLGDDKAERPVPFGPYTYQEMISVLDDEKIDVRPDEYIVKSTLRKLST